MVLRGREAWPVGEPPPWHVEDRSSLRSPKSPFRRRVRGAVSPKSPKRLKVSRVRSLPSVQSIPVFEFDENTMSFLTDVEGSLKDETTNSSVGEHSLEKPEGIMADDDVHGEQPVGIDANSVVPLRPDALKAIRHAAWEGGLGNFSAPYVPPTLPTRVDVSSLAARFLHLYSTKRGDAFHELLFNLGLTPAALATAVDCIWQEYDEELPLASQPMQTEPSRVGLFALRLWSTPDHTPLTASAETPDIARLLKQAVHTVTTNVGNVTTAWDVIGKWIKTLVLVQGMCTLKCSGGYAVLPERGFLTLPGILRSEQNSAAEVLVEGRCYNMPWMEGYLCVGVTEGDEELMNEGVLEGVKSDRSLRMVQRVMGEWKVKAPPLPLGSSVPLTTAQEGMLQRGRMKAGKQHTDFDPNFYFNPVDIDRVVPFTTQLWHCYKAKQGDVIDELTINLSPAPSTCIRAVLIRLLKQHPPHSVSVDSLLSFVVDLLRHRTLEGVNNLLGGGTCSTVPIVDIETSLKEAVSANTPDDKRQASRKIRQWIKTIMLLVSYAREEDTVVHRKGFGSQHTYLDLEGHHASHLAPMFYSTDLESFDGILRPINSEDDKNDPNPEEGLLLFSLSKAPVVKVSDVVRLVAPAVPFTVLEVSGDSIKAECTVVETPNEGREDVEWAVRRLQQMEQSEVEWANACEKLIGGECEQRKRIVISGEAAEERFELLQVVLNEKACTTLEQEHFMQQATVHKSALTAAHRIMQDRASFDALALLNVEHMKQWLVVTCTEAQRRLGIQLLALPIREVYLRGMLRLQRQRAHNRHMQLWAVLNTSSRLASTERAARVLLRSEGEESLKRAKVMLLERLASDEIYRLEVCQTEERRRQMLLVEAGVIDLMRCEARHVAGVRQITARWRQGVGTLARQMLDNEESVERLRVVAAHGALVEKCHLEAAHLQGAVDVHCAECGASITLAEMIQTDSFSLKCNAIEIQEDNERAILLHEADVCFTDAFANVATTIINLERRLLTEEEQGGRAFLEGAMSLHHAAVMAMAREVYGAVCELISMQRSARINRSQVVLTNVDLSANINQYSMLPPALSRTSVQAPGTSSMCTAYSQKGGTVLDELEKNLGGTAVRSALFKIVMHLSAASSMPPLLALVGFLLAVSPDDIAAIFRVRINILSEVQDAFYNPSSPFVGKWIKLIGLLQHTPKLCYPSVCYLPSTLPSNTVLVAPSLCSREPADGYKAVTLPCFPVSETIAVVPGHVELASDVYIEKLWSLQGAVDDMYISEWALLGAWGVGTTSTMYAKARSSSCGLERQELKERKALRQLIAAEKLLAAEKELEDARIKAEEQQRLETKVTEERQAAEARRVEAREAQVVKPAETAGEAHTSGQEEVAVGEVVEIVTPDSEEEDGEDEEGYEEEDRPLSSTTSSYTSSLELESEESEPVPDPVANPAAQAGDEYSSVESDEEEAEVQGTVVQEEDKWKCTRCTYNNIMSQVECEMCGKPAPPQQWTCRVCTYQENSGTRCTMCDTEKNIPKAARGSEQTVVAPAPVPAPAPAPVPDAPKEWVCGSCTFLNKGSMGKCEICEHEKGSDHTPRQVKVSGAMDGGDVDSSSEED